MSKRYETVIVALVISCAAFGQKINSCTYGHVDEVLQYNDAQIIRYKDKNGKSKADTIFYSKQKCDIHIDWASVVSKFDTDLKKHFHFKTSPKQ